MDKLDLQLMSYVPQLKLKKDGAVDYVWDPLRKKYLVLQPEEFVRQLLIIYFKEVHSIPFIRMSSEYLIPLFKTQKRCDLLIFDPNGKVLLLAECKSFKEKKLNLTIDQIQNYNLYLDAPRLLITNGPDCLYFERSEGAGFQLTSDIKF